MLALFSKFWCAPTVRQKARITSSTLTTFGRLPASAVDSQVGQNFARVHIAHHSAFRNLDDHVFATTTVQILAHSVHAIACPSVGVIAKSQQRSNVVVSH